MRPSPGSSNEEAGLVLNEPTLSLPSGFYQGSISLSMEADQDCVIRYTLDGSEPDMNSKEYTEPLLLSTPATGRISMPPAPIFRRRTAVIWLRSRLSTRPSSFGLLPSMPTATGVIPLPRPILSTLTAKTAMRMPPFFRWLRIRIIYFPIRTVSISAVPSMTMPSMPVSFTTGFPGAT